MLKRSKPRPTFIRHWRKFRKMTAAELAEAIDKSESLVSLIERGESPYSRDTLEAIAQALECEPVDLLTRDPNETPSLWSLYARAKPAQRRQLERLAEALLKEQEGGDGAT